MPNKPLLPGFSKAMIKRHKIQGTSKESLIAAADYSAHDYVARQNFEIETQDISFLIDNTLEAISEIWEQD